MSDILEQLKADHRNVSLLLNRLDRELDAIHDAKSSVDFELMRNIMVYMTHYPDITHHPKEDLIFERLQARDQNAASIVADLEKEHEALAANGAAFRDVLSSVVDGEMVRSDELEAQGRHYVEFLRNHMKKEDEEAFPLAEATLGENDWEHVAEEFATHQDPVFGPVVQEEYVTLYEHIDIQRDT